MLEPGRRHLVERDGQRHVRIGRACALLAGSLHELRHATQGAVFGEEARRWSAPSFDPSGVPGRAPVARRHVPALHPCRPDPLLHLGATGLAPLDEIRRAIGSLHWREKVDGGARRQRLSDGKQRAGAPSIRADPDARKVNQFGGVPLGYQTHPEQP